MLTEKTATLKVWNRSQPNGSPDEKVEAPIHTGVKFIPTAVAITLEPSDRQPYVFDIEDVGHPLRLYIGTSTGTEYADIDPDASTSHFKTYLERQASIWLEEP